MTRRDAVAIVLDALPRHHVVMANGFLSRDGCAHGDAERYFYMLGSMGLAASIGLGVALVRPEARVAVLDGDGNVLMGLSALPMAGAWRPRHLLHVVLDNGCYASTGGLRSV